MSETIGNKAHNKHPNRHGRQDEIYQVNALAYLQADLKINELRIIVAIVSALQTALRFKLSRHFKTGTLPASLLPPLVTEPLLPVLPGTRFLTIPVSAFHLSTRNTPRLRTYLEHLTHVDILLPDRSSVMPDRSAVMPDPIGHLMHHGFISGYHFPPYATTVDIYLSESLLRCLLSTEEGYGHYSRSLALSLTSKHTLRLYWLICSWRNRGGFVIPLDKFRRLLSLGTGYDKTANIIARILEPARAEFSARFPIWFEYRITGTTIAFKIKESITPDEEQQLRRSANDFAYGLLTQNGISPDAITGLMATLAPNELRPFLLHLSTLCTRIRSNREIKDPAAYLLAALQTWLDNWPHRFAPVPE